MSAQAIDAELAQALAATDQKSPSRCCFLLHVRKDMLLAYVEDHQHVWESMRTALSESGWRNYSLFLDPTNGMVVGYFEADDVVAAQEVMATTQVNAQWQEAMRNYFVMPDGGTNQVLPQYFYLA